jgi:hypothetical protein
MFSQNTSHFSQNTDPLNRTPNNKSSKNFHNNLLLNNDWFKDLVNLIPISIYNIISDHIKQLFTVKYKEASINLLESKFCSKLET